jgi:threonine dehydratase
MLARCIDRGLFLPETRAGLSIVLPYGIGPLTALLEILARHHAEVISCVWVPHVDTGANKERYTVIVDLASSDRLSAIKEDCSALGSSLRIGNSAAADE